VDTNAIQKTERQEIMVYFQEPWRLRSIASIPGLLDEDEGWGLTWTRWKDLMRIQVAGIVALKPKWGE